MYEINKQSFSFNFQKDTKMLPTLLSLVAVLHSVTSGVIIYCFCFYVRNKQTNKLTFYLNFQRDTKMLPILLSVLAVLHSVSSDVIINELNADNPQSDDTEYIELYNTDNSAVALDTYVIVLYNGANDIAYDVIYLTRKTIPARGYFVIGSSNVVPTPDFVLPADSNIFQNGPDGVALYNGDPGSFSVGMAVTGVGLVDAIVYSRYSEVTYRFTCH